MLKYFSITSNSNKVPSAGFASFSFSLSLFSFCFLCWQRVIRCMCVVARWYQSVSARD